MGGILLIYWNSPPFPKFCTQLITYERKEWRFKRQQSKRLDNMCVEILSPISLWLEL
jgi:hypothetical protein